MPKRRLTRSEIEAAKQSVDAIGELPDFKPGNKNQEHAALVAERQRMIDKQNAEEATQRVLNADRDEAVAAEYAFYNLVKDARTTVRGQYGADSLEAQRVGFKRESEIKRGGRKSGSGTPTS